MNNYVVKSSLLYSKNGRVSIQDQYPIFIKSQLALDANQLITEVKKELLMYPTWQIASETLLVNSATASGTFSIPTNYPQGKNVNTLVYSVTQYYPGGTVSATASSIGSTASSIGATASGATASGATASTGSTASTGATASR